MAALGGGFESSVYATAFVAAISRHASRIFLSLSALLFLLIASFVIRKLIITFFLCLSFQACCSRPSHKIRTWYLNE